MKSANKTENNPAAKYQLGKFQLLIGYYYLRLALIWQNFSAPSFIKEITTLSATLNKDIFPALIELSQEVLIASPTTEKTGLLLTDQSHNPLAEVVTSPLLASFMAYLKISHLNLDPRLESDQIKKALTILIYAGKSLHHALNQKPARNNRITTTLLSNTGLNAFCCNIKVDLTQKSISIRYSYCELFYSFTVKTFLQRYTHSKNHQAIFSIAPKFGFLIGLLFLLHHLYWAPFSLIGVIAASLGAIGLGTGITYLFNTLASTIYDQEYRDKLLKENTREIRALSYFPIHNPNPIIKVSLTGEVLFANEAAYQQAEAQGLPREALIEILPENFQSIVRSCISSSKEIPEIDSLRHGRTIRYKISPFPHERSALIAGVDITQTKKLEHELRSLNMNLEKLVEERTNELQSTQDIAILSLSSLAETRDHETGAHLLRTRLYVKILAEHLRHHPNFRSELDDDQIIDLLFRSAPLHDIGKVGIPDAILLKPDKLTEEEFTIMKQHPTIGGDSLQWAETKLGKNSFLKLARQIAYYHHEWWNGTGYPFGLAGSTIPMSSRLMAVADVYDALTSQRVYKVAFSHEKSKDIIVKGKASHFDPDIVEAFLEIEEDFINIHKSHSPNV